MKKYTLTARGASNLKMEPDYETGNHVAIAEGDDVVVSDGYHTMDDLYDHRIRLYIQLCKTLTRTDPKMLELDDKEVWRSKSHADGTMFEGWFIMGIGKAPGHQITYHLPMGYWNECFFAQDLEKAPEWDGHTPGEVLQRLKDL